MILTGIEEYVSIIKNKIDKEMVDMKKVYEKLQKAIRNFNQQYRQRNQMTSLLTRAQDNNKRIQNLLEMKSENRTSPGANDREEFQTTNRLGEKLDAIRRIFQSVQDKKLNLSHAHETKHHQAVDKMLTSLSNLKSQLEDLKLEAN